LCDPCLDGEGGECHTPGCMLWLCSGPATNLREYILFAEGTIEPERQIIGGGG
jgi:hypothetical protein